MTDSTTSRPSLGLLLFTGRYPGDAHGAALRRAADLATAAESAGWDSAWITEHHFNPHLESSAATLVASHLLGATERLHVGTAAAVLSVHHPLVLAEHAALIDHLAPGRFTLGVARGMPTVDFEVLGDGPQRGEPEAFAVALDVLLAGLAGEAVHGDGTHFDIPGVRVVPEPRHGIEVAVAANTESTVRAAAERGLPMLLSPVLPIEAKVGLLEMYRHVADAAGHDPDSVDHCDAATVLVAPTREDGVRQLHDTWVPWFVDVQSDAPLLRPLDSPYSIDDFRGMADIQPVGPATDVAAEIVERLERLGLCRTMLIVDATGHHDDAHRTVTELAHALGLARG